MRLPSTAPTTPYLVSILYFFLVAGVLTPRNEFTRPHEHSPFTQHADFRTADEPSAPQRDVLERSK